MIYKYTMLIFSSLLKSGFLDCFEGKEAAAHKEDEDEGNNFQVFFPKISESFITNSSKFLHWI